MISSDQANVIIEFAYQSEDETINMPVKYQVIDGVPTIYFEDGETSCSVPVSFFTETVEFLTKQGVIDQAKQTVAVSDSPVLGSNATLPAKKTPILPIPQVEEDISEDEVAKIGISGDLADSMKSMDVKVDETIEPMVSFGVRPSKKKKTAEKKEDIPADALARPVIRGSDLEGIPSLRNVDEKKKIKRA